MTGLRRKLLRRAWWVLVCAGTFGVVYALLPALVLNAPESSGSAAVDRLAVEHDCVRSFDRVPGHPLMLIGWPDGSADLVLPASGVGGAAAQNARFTEQRASFYGWCRP